MDISPKLHIVKVVWFNTDYKDAFVNPSPCPVGHRKCVLFIDVSESMEKALGALKLSVSFFKALAGMPRLPDLPKPSKRTNLIGAVTDYLKSETIGVEPGEDVEQRPKVVIFTDGLDNEYKHDVIPVGRDERGLAINRTLPPTSDANYIEERQSAVLRHLTDYAKVEVCLIGLGFEVKKLLKVAENLPVTVAEVQQEATPKEICTLINAAVRRPRPNRVYNGRSRAQGSVAERQKPIITTANVVDSDVPCTTMIAQAEATASTYVLGMKQQVSPEEFKAAFERIEASAGFGFDTASAEGANLRVVKFARAAVLWILNEAHERQTSVPATLVNGRFRTIVQGEFADRKLVGQYKTPINRILGGLVSDRSTGCKLLVSEKVEAYSYTSDVFSISYDKEHPAYMPNSAHGVGECVAAMIASADGWAMPHAGFLENTVFKSRKRAREEPEPAAAAAAAAGYDQPELEPSEMLPVDRELAALDARAEILAREKRQAAEAAAADNED